MEWNESFLSVLFLYPLSLFIAKRLKFLFFVANISSIISIIMLKFVSFTLSGAIGSLGCRRSSSGGSVLIRQLTELQIMTCSWSVESYGISDNSVGYHWSPLSLCSWLRWYPAECTENHLGQLHLNTWVFPAHNPPIQLNIDRKLT